MDANFRQQELQVRSYTTDPGFHTGLAYFADRKDYYKYTLKPAATKETVHANFAPLFLLTSF